MKRAIPILPALFFGSFGQAQLVINEVCSKNLNTITDAFGNRPDWVEVRNTGTSPIALADYFLSDDDAAPEAWALPDMDLAPGEVVVLFHGDANLDGLHFPFKIDQLGESLLLSAIGGNTVDVLNVPTLRADHSYGRSPDGGNAGFIFAGPTPGNPDNGPGYIGYTQEPELDRPPGSHNGPLNVQVSGCAECQVHFTVDGRVPDATAANVTSAIVIQNTTVLKAIAYRPDHLPSEVTSSTYLINSATDLPIVALSTHPDSLFDDELGLYMLGADADTVYPHWGANFWDERGVDVRFEYFDEQGVRRIDQDVELRIHGGRASRNKPQRPLRLTARDELGEDRIRYLFFPEKPELDAFKRIILRNAGSDWCQAHYRDGFFHQTALHAGLDIDVLAFKPSAVYINGEYWGIMNIRERVDEDYLASNHGVDEDRLLLMNEENWPIQGDSLHFDSLQRFIRTHDMADDAHFLHVDSLLDLHSFMDYFALEMFSGNSDWPSNNVKYWKPAIQSGKWRYLMYDMDATMAAASWLPNDFDMFYWLHVHREGTIHAEIYQSLIQRPEFRRQFLNRLADLMNTCLGPEELLAENERMRNVIREEVPRHYHRWSADPATWHTQTGSVIPDWARARSDHMREDVLEWYDLPNIAALHFDVFPSGAGRLRVNSITPAVPFDGIYFNGNDIDVSVEAAPGFTFSHWSYSAEPGVDLNSVELHRSFAGDGDLVAHFAKTGAAIYAVPNPTADRCDVSYEAKSSGPVEISIWDAQGRSVRSWRSILVTGVNRLPVDLSAEAAGLFELRIDENGHHSAIRLMKY
ncbi:MAG TPA: CotH kinase family protein [Flavobacteriales bacterium]|nr:CotH kinase family protein [Flavobacteriales bacterium]